MVNELKIFFFFFIILTTNPMSISKPYHSFTYSTTALPKETSTREWLDHNTSYIKVTAKTVYTYQKQFQEFQFKEPNFLFHLHPNLWAKEAPHSFNSTSSIKSNDNQHQDFTSSSLTLVANTDTQKNMYITINKKCTNYQENQLTACSRNNRTNI